MKNNSIANNLMRDIIRDFDKKLKDMFDANFQQQGYFGKKWIPTKVSKVDKKGKRGSMLIVTGALRRSIRSAIKGNSIIFSSNLPYAALHNEGGKFKTKVAAHSRVSQNGKPYDVRAHTMNVNMPQRQFVGDSPQVRQALNDIAVKNIEAMNAQMKRQFERR